MKKKPQFDYDCKITNQTIIIDGRKISLNFRASNNEEIGADIRTMLLKNSSANLDNRVDSR